MYWETRLNLKVPRNLYNKQKGGIWWLNSIKIWYHHVEIHKAFQQYLGFSWSVNGEIKYYVFTVLPFGLSSAPFLFTRLVREIVKYWRSLSYPIIVYLDDGWCCLNTEFFFIKYLILLDKINICTFCRERGKKRLGTKL